MRNLLLPKKAIRKVKGWAYRIKPPIVDWGENEIAIEIHCDAGQILTKSGSRAKIGICGLLRKQITEQTKSAQYRQGNAVPWVSNKSPRSSTSSFAGEIQEVFYGRDMARLLKGMLAELLFGNIGGRNTYVCAKR